MTAIRKTSTFVDRRCACGFALRPVSMPPPPRPGGRFYTADSIGGLVDDVQTVGGGVTVIEERDLWDMPAVLLLFLTLVVGEWGYRRARGLA